MQINKIYGNMNFGLKNSGQSKYTRDPRSTKFSNVQLKKPFYGLTKQGNLPNDLKRQLSPHTLECIEGILEDIKTGKKNPNITTVSGDETVGDALSKAISNLLDSKNPKNIEK